MSGHIRMIDRWFPCKAVDRAVGTPEGSGRSEKAIFTWFASRPVAQARGAVLTALLPDDASHRTLVDRAITDGDAAAFDRLRSLIAAEFPEGRPVVLDMFSGRGIIPLEAARLNVPTVGIDYSPVATLAGRLLADYPFRDWGAEPYSPFRQATGDKLTDEGAPRLERDVSAVLDEVGRRMAEAVEKYYPRNDAGEFPWGYLWAISIPCDGCGRRFPLVGSLTLRNPYHRRQDPGQAMRFYTDGDDWRVEVFEGVPDQAPTFAAPKGKKGKVARCLFCGQVHALDTVKAKGMADQYRDELLLVGEIDESNKKWFRLPTEDELHAAVIDLADLAPFGDFPAVPDEPIPPGNEDTVRASGYGFRTYGELMNPRQTLQFVELVRAIHEVTDELIGAGCSEEYVGALAAYCGAALVRKMRRSTRGSKLLAHGNPQGTGQNRVQTHDVFSDESKLSFNFDYFETGPGAGPGTWNSIVETGMTSLARHLQGTRTGRPGTFRQGSSMALPFRDNTVDVVVTDPPYYNMIDYTDASDVFYVWLKRALHDTHLDLFNAAWVLQPKDEEIIVKRGNAPGEHRTKEFYQASLARSFEEARRVLRSGGSLVVVFGHSDPDAWRQLLGALHEAGFVVTGSWPARTETSSTGVASIRVTVTISCRVAAEERPVGIAAAVENQVIEAVKSRVPEWARDGLALPDQIVAAYGPAMEVYGSYSKVVGPDGSELPTERFFQLSLGAVRDAAAGPLEAIPLKNFDGVTRFAVFWLRAYGLGTVPKGDARALAQYDNLRLEDIRDGLLQDHKKSGYQLMLEPAGEVNPRSPVFDVVRAMASGWQNAASEGVVEVILAAERSFDDEQVWAVAAELNRVLPQSRGEAKALADIFRNRANIGRIVQGETNARFAAESQLRLEVE